jgi:hypothetical protein
MDSWTTYTHHSELQVIRTLSLIPTLYKSLHAKSSPVCCVFTSRSLVTASNSGDSSASRTRVLSSQPPVQNSALNRPVRLSDSESYITTDGQSASLSGCQSPIWGLRPDFYYCQTVAGLLMWGALSDERTGLSFTITAGYRQHNHSRVRVSRDS